MTIQPTSLQARASIERMTHTLRGEVFRFIRDWSGSTDEEIQVGLEMNPSTERPRRGELVEQGLIEDSGSRRKTQSGHLAIIWHLTDVAR